MDRGAESTSSAKRAKKDKEARLVRRRNELILGVAKARAEGMRLVRNAEETAEYMGRDEEEEAQRLKREAEEEAQRLKREAEESLAQHMPSVCTELEAANRDELLKKLPAELWSKIIHENVHGTDWVALAMTCRFFREKQKDVGWWQALETQFFPYILLEDWKSGEMAPHTLGWFRWVCNTLEVLPGFECSGSNRRMIHDWGVYEGDLVNYAVLQGSVEILRWLMEEKGWLPNEETGWWAGIGGSIEVLEYLWGKGCEFHKGICAGAAMQGRLEALKFLRDLDPPCPWDYRTCMYAAEEGHLEVLKWARAQEPPCPWDAGTCSFAAGEGHLEVLKWARSQDPPCPWGWRTCTYAAQGGHLDVLKWARSQDPPCPWRRGECRADASKSLHWHIVKWIDQQED